MELVEYNKTYKLNNPYIAKCVLLGDSGVGKSTILNVMINGKFENSYSPTIGIDFATKKITLSDCSNQQIKLQIWDTAGQEKFKSIVSSYLRDVHIAFLVFDLTDRKSWDNLEQWKDKLYLYSIYNNIPLVYLVGTKSDLPNHQVSQREIEERCALWDCDYYVVSATQDDSNVKLFRMFYKSTDQFHQIIVYKQINDQDIPTSIIKNVKNIKSNQKPYIDGKKNKNNKKKQDSMCCFQ